ncbi:hypothetical protein, partial [Algibacter sp.]|uniref:hypothetical protein n=1 Tax=Algibacter sp. TaxID=1872428 RepID=UPI003C7493E2
LELSLPDNVNVHVTEKPGTNAYFTVDITGSELAGTGIAAWCVDQDLSLYINESAEFSVYSSYETLPANEFEVPENFELVNWLLNQTIIGEASVAGGNYTFGHVQYAIWLLVDESVCVECSALAAPGEASWTSNSAVNVAMAEEIAQAARDNGADYVPGCGEKVGIILNPAGKQAIMIMVDVPEMEVGCSDCEGKVTSLDLEFDWGCAKKIDILQRDENSCYGKWIYNNNNVQPNGEINLTGGNSDGSFGRYIYIYINNCYYTKIKTDCDVNIGPGYEKGVFNVISGESSNGGELCEYVKPDYNKCYRHWGCKYRSSCRYSSGGH